jgi:hypothetical protein
MKLSLTIILIFFNGLIILAQSDKQNLNSDTSVVIGKSYEKTAYVIGFTPSKATKINGLSLGWALGSFDEDYYEMPYIDTLTINGIQTYVSILQVFAGVILTVHVVLDEIPSRIFKNEKYNNDTLEIFQKPVNEIQGNINGLSISLFESAKNLKMNGLQFSIFAHKLKNINGISISGFSSIYESQNGVAISGIHNKSKKGNGLQIGLVNQAENFKGIQIGLWNKIGKRGLPFINIGF